MSVSESKELEPKLRQHRSFWEHWYAFAIGLPGRRGQKKTLQWIVLGQAVFWGTVLAWSLRFGYELRAFVVAILVSLVWIVVSALLTLRAIDIHWMKLVD